MLKSNFRIGDFSPEPRKASVAAALLIALCGEVGLRAAEQKVRPDPAPNASTPWSGTVAGRQMAGGAPVVGKGSMGLVELLDSGLLHNPSTRAAWERARQQAALWRESKGTYWPQLDAGLEVSGRHTETESFSTTRRKVGRQSTRSDSSLSPELQSLMQTLSAMNVPAENEQVGTDNRSTSAEPTVNPYLTVTWLLFDFGAREAGVDGFKQSLIASNFVYNRQLQQVVRDVQRNYFHWDGTRAALEVQDNLVSNAKRSVELVDVRFKAGLTAKTDLLQAQQFLAQTEFDRESVALNLERQRSALLAAAGLLANSPVSLHEGDRTGVPKAFATGIGILVERGLAARPDLAARLATVRAADSDLRRVRREEIWPRISLIGSVEGIVSETESVTHLTGPGFAGGSMTEGNRTHTDTFDSFIGLSATVNLFDGFAKYRRIDRAASVREEAVAEYRFAEIGISAEIWNSWQGYLTARRQTELGQRLVAASRESYEAVTDAYKTGLKSILDVINAIDDLGRAELSELEARYRTLTEAVELAYAMGETAIPAVAADGAAPKAASKRKR
jgi:outer membrane protein TolC